MRKIIDRSALFRFFILIYFIALISFSASSDEEPAGNHTPGTLLACYLVGNDIESDDLLAEYGFIT